LALGVVPSVHEIMPTAAVDIIKMTINVTFHAEENNDDCNNKDLTLTVLCIFIPTITVYAAGRFTENCMSRHAVVTLMIN
jgi:hypothetical protein